MNFATGIIDHFNKSSKTRHGEEIWKAILSASGRYANRSRQWHMKQQQVPATQWAYGWGTAGDFMVCVSNRANSKDPFYDLYRTLNSLERGVLNTMKPIMVSCSFNFSIFVWKGHFISVIKLDDN